MINIESPHGESATEIITTGEIPKDTEPKGTEAEKPNLASNDNLLTLRSYNWKIILVNY